MYHVVPCTPRRGSVSVVAEARVVRVTFFFSSFFFLLGAGLVPEDRFRNTGGVL